MRYLKFFLFSVFVALMLTSCASLKFDRTTLQPDDYSLKQKLPNLEIQTADTTQIGASDQVSTASYVYTVFRRELAQNILDTADEATYGSIEMVIIYSDVDIDLWWYRNTVTLEFEINIYNKENKKVWTNTYSADTKVSANPNSTLTSTILNVGVVELEHLLIDQFKDDISLEYNSLKNKLVN